MIRILTALLTAGIYILLVRAYRIDPDFNNAVRSKSYLYFITLALVLGFLNGNMSFGKNLIMLMPIEVLLFSALTDRLMMQIYTLPCLISLAVGSFYSIFMAEMSEYMIYMAIVVICSFLMHIIKAINTGDVILLMGVYPYLYILGKLSGTDKMIIIAYGYFILTCVMALIINFRGFLKGKKKFPFAIPALAAYGVMILIMEKGNMLV